MSTNGFHNDDQKFIYEKKKKTRKEIRKEQQSNLQLKSIIPKTENQKKTFKEFHANKHLFLHGTAGTGKTFVSLYLALCDLNNTNSLTEKIYIIRSATPTKDIGFLPGKIKEKTQIYELPYYSIMTELYGRGDAYDILKNKNQVEFLSTSFLRGQTFNNCIVIFDESQNGSWPELYTIISRIGNNCRIIFAGDFKQSDIIKKHHNDETKNDILNFMNVIKKLNEFAMVEFTTEDIVRSQIIKSFILEATQQGYM